MNGVRNLLSTALEAVISLRLVPTKEGKSRCPPAKVLVNTAAVKYNIRDGRQGTEHPGT